MLNFLDLDAAIRRRASYAENENFRRIEVPMTLSSSRERDIWATDPDIDTRTKGARYDAS
jgi:hypothetical protein